MAEEQRCQEGHRLCANNCGFFGSPATLDLCSKCYRDLRLKEEQASSAKVAVENSLLSPPPSAPAAAAAASSSSPFSSSSAVSVTSPEAPASAAVRSQPATPAAVTAPQPANRCAGCRRKVGLTGFKCRCGATFCGAHRYPEQHACTFDFKAVGREAIARANPVVKAAKLDKI